MVLVAFQQALADLVASPALCRQVRADPDLLRLRYELSQREYERLVSNRLAPLALNLYGFCRSLGPRLGPLLTEYTERHPHSNVHFYSECDRFCAFVESKLTEGYELEPDARAVFAEECLMVRLNLKAMQIAL